MICLWHHNMTKIHKNSTFLGFLTINGTSNKKKTSYKCDPLKFSPKIFENHKKYFFQLYHNSIFSILQWTIFLISVIIHNYRNITFFCNIYTNTDKFIYQLFLRFYLLFDKNYLSKQGSLQMHCFWTELQIQLASIFLLRVYMQEV